MKKLRLNQSEEAKLHARKLRSNMSVSEQWFWAAVRKDLLGFRFRRQVAIGPYFLDFYVPKAKLCIEIDGEQHQDRIEQDQRRDAYLAEFGILTLRIPSLDLFHKEQDRYSAWIREVERICHERT